MTLNGRVVVFGHDSLNESACDIIFKGACVQDSSQVEKIAETEKTIKVTQGHRL